MVSEETIVISRIEYERFRSQETTISVLKHQLAELQRLIFGAKSERFKSASDQATGNLLNYMRLKLLKSQLKKSPTPVQNLNPKSNPCGWNFLRIFPARKKLLTLRTFLQMLKR